MPTKSVVVGSAVGLHARPAAIISEAAGELDSEVPIGVPGGRPGRRQLGAADHDPRRRQAATRSRSPATTEAAVDAIAALVEQDLDA